mgnify:CR=1 FL=1
MDPPPLAFRDDWQILRHGQNLLGVGDLVGGRRRAVAHDGKAAVLVDIDRHLIALAHLSLIHI